MCDLSNVHNQNRHESHLLGCSKSTLRDCDTGVTSPNKLRTNCKRCGHSNCGKLANQECDGLSCSNSKWNHSSPVRKMVPDTNSIERLTRSRSLSVQAKKSRKYATNVNRFSSAVSSSSLDTVGSSSTQLRIRDRIEQADVFLEALGNASTSKNFNSSRYGQFFNIEFDFKGDPIGGRIFHYSLEKTRVTSKYPSERNFHIFYQLISGADIQFLKSLKLHRNIDKYELLNHANATDDDKNNFSYTKKSLDVLGLNQDEILSIFKIIAVVIKLGNLVFVPTTNIDGTEGCNISNEYELMETAQLLSLDAQILLNCLTRADNGWNSVENGSDADFTNANRTRNSLCRIMYSRLFTWVVNRINDLLKSKSMLRGKNFGVLDFYGFENFEFNSFEQLIINYCDERVHQHCIRSTLKYQQELYLREGLEWTKVDFFDNEIICDLIDKSSYGILNLMDEPHMAYDDALLVRMQQCCAGHPNFLSLDTNAPYAGFQIRHFAGSVQYSINGFLEKNSEFLPRNVSSCLYQSKLPVVQSLFPEGNPKRLSRKPTSIGSSLRTQLQTLLSMVETRKTNYVFCIKPNEHRQNNVLEMALVQHQVRYMSLMPLVALWRSGHCYHINHHKFLSRYKMLNPDTWPHFRGDNVVEGIAILIRKLPLPHAEFTIGTRKVFIRSPRTVYELEEFRRSRLDSLACLIQTKFRSYSKRKEFLSLRNSQIIISSAWRTWRECRFGVPFSGRRHLWCLYKVAREEYRQQKYRKQVQWAICVIQRQYLQWKRRHFLLTLLLHLPPDSLSPLSSEWTAAPPFLAETSLLLRNIYHRWRCYKYRLTFDQTARNRMREKVTASIIFKDRKSSYPRSVAHPFLGDYVRLRHNSQWRKLSIDSSDQYVVFADIINKIARSSGKFVPILLVLSTSSMLLLDQRTLQIKYRVPATEIYRLSLSPYLDNIAVFHVKADCNNQQVCTETGCLFQSEIGRKKGDFVFQTGHVIEIVTKLFLVIQNATAKPPEVHISTEFEANFGQQTVVFTFKCSGMVGDMCPTKVTRKGNRMEIVI
ncbi:unconventional myosin-Ib [Bradysia coprophila]|uniref:unconventional myosin-Ib n=1 Tax=Bradysia coprophila TaxID=38358 RepID=UPI00187DBA63|nr:unconventional myosin-Ib [Bradysia coprophila]